MIEHIWTVLCAQSVIDIETNNISLQNVIEQITINSEPRPDGVLPMGFEVVSLWGRTDRNISIKGQERVRVISPSGNAISETITPIDLSSAERIRQRIKYRGLPAPEAGKYYFKIDFKEENGEWQQFALVPILIEFKPPKTD